jgi:hypothetical protein
VFVSAGKALSSCCTTMPFKMLTLFAALRLRVICSQASCGAAAAGPPWLVASCWCHSNVDTVCCRPVLYSACRQAVEQLLQDHLG